MSDFSRETMLTCRKHGRFSWDDSRVCPSCPDPEEVFGEQEACGCGSKAAPWPDGDWWLCGDCGERWK